MLNSESISGIAKVHGFVTVQSLQLSCVACNVHSMLEVRSCISRKEHINLFTLS